MSDSQTPKLPRLRSHSDPAEAYPQYDIAFMSDFFDFMNQKHDIFDEEDYEQMYRDAAAFLAQRHGYANDEAYYHKEILK